MSFVDLEEVLEYRTSRQVKIINTLIGCVRLWETNAKMAEGEDEVFLAMLYQFPSLLDQYPRLKKSLVAWNWFPRLHKMILRTFGIELRIIQGEDGMHQFYSEDMLFEKFLQDMENAYIKSELIS